MGTDTRKKMPIQVKNKISSPDCPDESIDYHNNIPVRIA
jgi:hypothetical protein